MNIKFKMNVQFFRRIFTRLGQIGIRPYALAFLAIALMLAYTSADLFSKIRKASVSIPRAAKTETGAAARSQAAGSAKKNADAYQAIARRNLFGSSSREIAGTGGQFGFSQLEQTSLQLELLGTVAGEGSYNCAVIDDKKKPRVYKIGDQVANATLLKIMRNTVVLRVGDKEEVLTVKVHKSGSAPPAARPPQPAATGAGGDAKTIGAFKEIKDILVQANARPHFEGGKMDGFYIGRVTDGSILKKIGLESGDIVGSVNGQSLEKPDDIYNLQKMQAPTGEKTSLKVMRQGKQITLNLD